MAYPDWVLRERKKGTEIRKMGNNFYLYKVTSVWDKEKKRAKKITEKFLGTITPDGLVEPRHERMQASLTKSRLRSLEQRTFC